MKKLILATLVATIFTGCSLWDNRVVAYQVIENGFKIWMTKEQIEKAKLDKVDMTLTGAYKIFGNAKVDNAQKK